MCMIFVQINVYEYGVRVCIVYREQAQKHEHGMHIRCQFYYFTLIFLRHEPSSNLELGWCPASPINSTCQKVLDLSTYSTTRVFYVIVVNLNQGLYACATNVPTH